MKSVKRYLMCSEKWTGSNQAVPETFAILDQDGGQLIGGMLCEFGVIALEKVLMPHGGGAGPQNFFGMDRWRIQMPVPH